MNADSICPKKRRHKSTNPMRHYDLELAVMAEITRHTGYQWSCAEIAEVCGVTRKAISHVTRTALRRAWRLLHRDEDFIRDLNESRGLDGKNRFFLP